MSKENYPGVKYKVLSPDGITIEFDKPLYDNIVDAEKALTSFIDRYKAQGYYSWRMQRIPLNELWECCSIVEVYPKCKVRKELLKEHEAVRYVTKDGGFGHVLTAEYLDYMWYKDVMYVNLFGEWVEVESKDFEFIN